MRIAGMQSRRSLGRYLVRNLMIFVSSAVIGSVFASVLAYPSRVGGSTSSQLPVDAIAVSSIFVLTQLLIIGSPIAMAYLVIIRWSNRFSRVVLILGALAAGTAWFLLISGFQAIEHFSAAQNLPYAAPWLIFGALIRPYHEPSELDGSTETQSNTRAPSSQTLPQRIFRGFARTAADFVAATAIGVAITETVRFLTGAFDGPSPFPLIVTDALFLALFTIVGGAPFAALIWALAHWLQIGTAFRHVLVVFGSVIAGLVWLLMLGGSSVLHEPVRNGPSLVTWVIFGVLVSLRTGARNRSRS